MDGIIQNVVILVWLSVNKIILRLIHVAHVSSLFLFIAQHFIVWFYNSLIHML